ncbi:hypothetical protein GCM10017056_38930 [Seohaeicola zhoushanensis]|uniref:Uncharacterized protein n=1 Tax=Seohaeicola zhoushanensis TaxID=1569283 RepID=A0A8J3MA17_9RHOB|nr:hypothetical protein GCM10017056_38930 [Seohaeicola zhoushanensis]
MATASSTNLEQSKVDPIGLSLPLVPQIIGPIANLQVPGVHAATVMAAVAYLDADEWVTYLIG